MSAPWREAAERVRLFAQVHDDAYGDGAIVYRMGTLDLLCSDLHALLAALPEEPELDSDRLADIERRLEALEAERVEDAPPAERPHNWETVREARRRAGRPTLDDPQRSPTWAYCDGPDCGASASRLRDGYDCTFEGCTGTFRIPTPDADGGEVGS